MTKTPEEIFHVSRSQLSVARHYGGCKYQGVSYHYDAERDALVRMDVWLDRLKAQSAEAKRAADEARDKWLSAQGSLL